MPKDEDYLAHAVDASAGRVNATDFDEPIPCVRLVFHRGAGGVADHSEEFLNPAALRPLIVQLEALAQQLGL